MSDVTFSPSGPVIKAWMEDDDSFVRGIVGPFGSGKTAGAVVEILRRAMAQEPGPDGIRRTRWAIIRNTFAELKSTTLKSWVQWCPAQFGKLTIGGSPITHRIQAQGLDIEVMFVPLDADEDVKKLLSMELTGALVDEAREIPKSVIDALTGRVGRYPSRLQGGCTWSGVLLVSNPGDTENWMFKTFYPSGPDAQVPEGWKLYRQPSGRSPEAENLQNLPLRYYDRMAAGKDPEWVKVYIDGEFGFTVEGKVVYPNFRDSVHVPPGPITPIPGLGLRIGADWGLTPAAVIGQELPDGRVHIVDEFVCEDSGIVRFATSLTAYLRANYPDFKITSCTGDPAGTARGNDEKTVFDLMNEYTPWRWRPARTNDPTLRIEVVTSYLNRMVDGKPGFQLSLRCGTLRKGFAGGYSFAPVGGTKTDAFHETPKKNKYSHPHDGLQYLLLDMGGADAVMNRDRSRTRQTVADDVDFPLITDEAPGRPQASGVVWGDGRPAHLGARVSRNTAGNTDSSIFD